MERNNMIALVSLLAAVAIVISTAIVQVQTTTRAKVAAGYTEQYVPYSNAHVWTK